MWEKSLSVSSLSSMSALDSSIPSFSSLSRESNDMVMIQSMSNQHLSSQEDSMNLLSQSGSESISNSSDLPSSESWGDMDDASSLQNPEQQEQDLSEVESHQEHMHSSFDSVSQSVQSNSLEDQLRLSQLYEQSEFTNLQQGHQVPSSEELSCSSSSQQSNEWYSQQYEHDFSQSEQDLRNTDIMVHFIGSDNRMVAMSADTVRQRLENHPLSMSILDILGGGSVSVGRQPKQPANSNSELLWGNERQNFDDCVQLSVQKQPTSVNNQDELIEMVDWPLEKLDAKLDQDEQEKKRLIEQEIKNNWKEIERRNCRIPPEIKDKLVIEFEQTFIKNFMDQEQIKQTEVYLQQQKENQNKRQEEQKLQKRKKHISQLLKMSKGKMEEEKEEIVPSKESSENIAFIQSLYGQLRVDALVNCNQEFLDTLNEELREEAKLFRRQYMMNFEYEPEMSPIQQNRVEEENKMSIEEEEEEKIVLETKEQKPRPKKQSQKKQVSILKKKKITQKQDYHEQIVPFYSRSNSTLLLKTIENCILYLNSWLDFPGFILPLIYRDKELRDQLLAFCLKQMEDQQKNQKIQLRCIFFIQQIMMIAGDSQTIISPDNSIVKKLVSFVELCSSAAVLRLLVLLLQRIVIMKPTDDSTLLIDDLQVRQLCGLAAATNSKSAQTLQVAKLISGFGLVSEKTLTLFVNELEQIVVGSCDIINQQFEAESITEQKCLIQSFNINFQDREIFLAKVVKIIQILFEITFEKFSKEEKKEENKEKEQKKEIVSKAKDKFSNIMNCKKLGMVWVNLIEWMLKFQRKNSKQLNIAINPILLNIAPLIEAFFRFFKIVYSDDEIINQQVTEDQGKQLVLLEEEKIIEKEGDNESEDNDQFDLNLKKQWIIDRIQTNDLFQIICQHGKKIINIICKQDVKMLNEGFSIILKQYPEILDFENKRNYFNQMIKKDRRKNEKDIDLSKTAKLNIRRNEIFMDSYAQIKQLTPKDLKQIFDISFVGEEAIDEGGVSREWYLLLSREIFNPNYALFQPSANGVTFQPSPQSVINPEHLQFFKFVGRIIGKALYDGYMLDAFFTRSFYKHILNKPLNLYDMEDIDPEYFKNLQWILLNNIAGIELTFSYDMDNFGQSITKDLIEDGRNQIVKEEQKEEYVKLLCYAKMKKNIEQQINMFLEGFHEVIPKDLISIFNARELELMISGLPDIDIQDLKINTIYQNYNQDSKIIKWFWEILETFDRQDKAEFLQFVTGTSKVPIGGFKELKGIQGYQKFCIQKSFEINQLPTSHTCFNQLDLPEYSSKKILKEKILYAIKEGKEGFGKK